ncbi:hypothetical protein LJC05_02230 [Bacteroides sp. OttesenSCG-928-J23]|nr:hypothetical protein [Bacteroides sp. OttesenSCG-928-J23]
MKYHIPIESTKEENYATCTHSNERKYAWTWCAQNSRYPWISDFYRERNNAEKYSDPIAIEKKRRKKNISSEELHSSSAEDTIAAADALKFSVWYMPDDEVCWQVVDAV